jgi:DNA-binding transcriptional ArsR family regulator
MAVAMELLHLEAHRDPTGRGGINGLTYADMGIYVGPMARAATTSDPFNAIAEPRRREILDALADGERSVGELVDSLGLAQPAVSKHLRVLHDVGLVDVREAGRHRLYRLDGRALKPIYDWIRAYEQTWEDRFELLDEVLDELKTQEQEQEHDDDGR